MKEYSVHPGEYRGVATETDRERGDGRHCEAAVLAQGPQWPTKAVSLLVGYPPGGLTDAGARHVQAGMSTSLAQTVIIENKAGAGGNLAAGEVQRAAPDGYKLLIANTSFTINPHTFATPSPDPTEFTPIGTILESVLVLCVNADTPVKNLKEFLAWVKSESAGKGFSYASSGNGGNTHLAMEYLRERTGLPQLNHVPYKGSAPAIQDVIGNQVPCMTLFGDGPSWSIPADAREVYDVSGAGDTVIAVLGAALGAGADLREAVTLANRAGGIVVGKLGTATVSYAELFG